MTQIGTDFPDSVTALPLLDDSETELLFCQQERLDQQSPELWPESIPGVTEFTASTLFQSHINPVLDATVEATQQEELSKEDYEMLQELGSLTVAQIIDKFQNLKQQAYALGVEEAREMTRGKYLNVLAKPKESKKKKV